MDSGGTRFSTRWGEMGGGAWEKDGHFWRDDSGKVLTLV